MDLKERILAYMKEEAYKPLLAEDLAEGMQLTPEELEAKKRQMDEENDLSELKKNDKLENRE